VAASLLTSGTLVGSRISSGDLAVTRRGCAAPILAPEQAFLAALRAATAYEVGDRLTLRDDGGEVATFVRPSVQPIVPAGPTPGRLP
jgi:heat shock protein HslJ